jgi:hypothetical protein
LQVGRYIDTLLDQDLQQIRDRWRFVAESWFALSAEDQKEALAVAAAESGWPAFLLEKDIWVVWALQILGTDQQLLQSLTFKGGTSLSKAHGLIDRFSEDVDLTVNIQHLWPDVDLAPAATHHRSPLPTADPGA